MFRVPGKRCSVIQEQETSERDFSSLGTEEDERGLEWGEGVENLRRPFLFVWTIILLV